MDDFEIIPPPPPFESEATLVTMDNFGLQRRVSLLLPSAGAGVASTGTATEPAGTGSVATLSETNRLLQSIGGMTFIFGPAPLCAVPGPGTVSAFVNANCATTLVCVHRVDFAYGDVGSYTFGMCVDREQFYQTKDRVLIPADATQTRTLVVQRRFTIGKHKRVVHQSLVSLILEPKHDYYFLCTVDRNRANDDHYGDWFQQSASTGEPTLASLSSSSPFGTPLDQSRSQSQSQIKKCGGRSRRSS